VACRDLQKGTLLPGESTKTLQREQSFFALCHLTDGERVALQSCSAVTSGCGAWHVQLVTSWIMRMLQDSYRAGLLEESELHTMQERMQTFTASYREARSLSYNETPFQYHHIFLLLVSLFCFTVPFALADTFGHAVCVPTVVIAAAFFGLNEISRNMEKPFGFDYHDIQVDQMVKTLHSDYIAIAQLSLSGALLKTPESTGGDIVAALLRKKERMQASSRTHSSCTPPPAPVRQYSLHRLQSFNDLLSRICTNEIRAQSHGSDEAPMDDEPRLDTSGRRPSIYTSHGDDGSGCDGQHRKGTSLDQRAGKQREGLSTERERHERVQQLYLNGPVQAPLRTVEDSEGALQTRFSQQSQGRCNDVAFLPRLSTDHPDSHPKSNSAPM